MIFLDKECYVKVKNEWVEAEFVGVFQYSFVIDPSPMIGGQPGGMIAYPIAVIKRQGNFEEVKTSDVIFQELD